MEWIKCSDRLPKHRVFVMATVLNVSGKKYLVNDAAYNAETKEWEYTSAGTTAPFNTERETVTHWMDYPEPATD